MPPFIGQAQIRPQSRLLELADLNDAFTGVRQASDRKIQNDNLMAQQDRTNKIQDKELKQSDESHRADMKQKDMMRLKSMSGLAQASVGNPQNWQNFLAADPGLANKIPENIRSDPVAGPQFVIDVTRGYQDKLSQQQAQASLDLTRAKIDGLRNPQQQADQTNDIKEYQFARQDGFSGSFEDWMSRPKASSQVLTATDRKAILEADDKIAVNQASIDALDQALKLNDKAGYGFAAKTRAEIASNLGLGGEETLDLDNLVTKQALDSLKATFGGAISDGERAVLIEVAGSVNQRPEVRKSIFERAKALAEKRLRLNRDRANALRGGTYYKPQTVDPQQQPPPESPPAADASPYKDTPDDELMRNLGIAP